MTLNITSNIKGAVPLSQINNLMQQQKTSPAPKSTRGGKPKQTERVSSDDEQNRKKGKK
jgi:hypothetical protein